MKKLIKPSKISGKIKAPPSKSFMQRAVAAAVLTKGKIVIHNPSFCDDSISAMNVAVALGCDIRNNKDRVEIENTGFPCSRKLDCGESGLCLRMFSPLASLFEEEFILNASGTALKRPAGVEKPLSDLGAFCETNGGFPPVRVKGPIRGGRVSVDGSGGSQVLTGLLMALPTVNDDSVIEVRNLKSIPYVEMTLSILRDSGITVTNDNFETFKVKGSQKYSMSECHIEGDWSGASFFLVAGAICGDVEIEGLNTGSLQADRVILDVLKKAGAGIDISTGAVKVFKNKLKCFEFDLTHAPDLFPPVFVLACSAEGESILKGVGRLKHKESSRAEVFKNEFSKVGARVEISGDFMKVSGGNIEGGKVFSHGDHRIAMAASILALNSNSEIIVEGSESVRKSYPGFFDDLGSLGGIVNE